ncbi:MAG TPA: O-methyltransferase [Terriglobia bacterium]|nr:O-methyltransferase [Terriglobia bacterium]
MITDPNVDQYIRSLIPERDAVLTEMEDRAARERIPIIGPVVGTLLSQLSQAIQAKRIAELGSAIGYSTIWLARAAGGGGKVLYTDGSETNARDAARYFERAGVNDRIEIRVGDALQSFSHVPGQFDVIFNDVDKEGYPEVYRQAAHRVRVGGFFITDNALRRGRVADPTVQGDAEINAVREFNELLSSDSRFQTTVLPLRDGVTVALRVRA